MKKFNKIIVSILIILSISLTTFLLIGCNKASNEEFLHEEQIIKNNEYQISAKVIKINKFYYMDFNDAKAQILEFEIRIDNEKQQNSNDVTIRFNDFDFYCLNEITIYKTYLSANDLYKNDNENELQTIEIPPQQTKRIFYRVVYKQDDEKIINNYILKLCGTRI